MAEKGLGINGVKHAGKSLNDTCSTTNIGSRMVINKQLFSTAHVKILHPHKRQESKETNVIQVSKWQIKKAPVFTSCPYKDKAGYICAPSFSSAVLHSERVTARTHTHARTDTHKVLSNPGFDSSPIFYIEEYQAK